MIKPSTIYGILSGFCLTIAMFCYVTLWNDDQYLTTAQAIWLFLIGTAEGLGACCLMLMSLIRWTEEL